MVVYGNVIFERDLAQTMYKRMSSRLADGVRRCCMVDEHTLYFESEVDRLSRKKFDNILTGQRIAPYSKIKYPKVGEHTFMSDQAIAEAKAILSSETRTVS